MQRIRPVEEKDLSHICLFPESEDELFFMFPKASYPLTPEQLKTAIAQRSDSMVVELDQIPVAFANFYRWEKSGCCAIGNVAVATSARRRGVGRYLIEQMIRLAFLKHDAQEVSVSCFHHNIAGLLLYPKLGFQPYAIEERRDHAGKRVALIHMRMTRNAFEAAQSDAHNRQR